MSTSPSSAPSPSISKSEYYSSLPWFRRLLAMLNWRPVVDYELREIEFDRREIEFEKRKIAHEQRMKQLRSENERLAELNAKLSAILSSSATSSSPANPTPNESEM
jgi:hypothetical protein